MSQDKIIIRTKKYWHNILKHRDCQSLKELDMLVIYPYSLVCNGEEYSIDSSNCIGESSISLLQYNPLSILTEYYHLTEINDSTIAIASNLKCLTNDHNIIVIKATIIMNLVEDEFAINYINVNYRKGASLDQKYQILDEDLKAIIGILLRRAEHDQMTNVLNSSSFKSYTIEKLKECKKGAFFIFDIDSFKEVNDNHGHLVGDSLLIAFSKALNTVFENEGIIGRMGGDEFVVFVPNSKEEEWCENKFVELHNKYLQYSSFQMENVKKSAFSCGVVIIDKPISYDCIVKKADDGLYLSKRTKNTITIVR